MTRRGYKPLSAIQTEYINRLVSRLSYRDTKLDESINLLTPHQLEQALIDKYGEIRTGICLTFERGEVTADPYGRGSLQRITEEP